MTDAARTGRRGGVHRGGRLAVRGALAASIVCAMTVAIVAIVSSVYAIPLPVAADGVARAALGPLVEWVHRADRRDVEERVAAYLIGDRALLAKAPESSWSVAESDRELVTMEAYSGPAIVLESVPAFVYESPDARFLAAFRAEWKLDDLIRGAGDEYDAMLRLAGWLGKQWDHGTDLVPEGRRVCDPGAAIRAGRGGARFWCEIAAGLAVHAATSLGWPARVVTASRDGYAWEHAVAEFWSNRFAKWFVVDTDFNVVFERDGVPLSAYELTHDGPELQRTGRLTVRSFAPPKPSLPYADLLPFFAYVHVDLRNDWCTRHLARGSPAGGESATYWTARRGFHPILTRKVREDRAARFDWPVNTVALHRVGVEPAGEGARLFVQLAGYSPWFGSFEMRVDGGEWARVSPARAHELTLGRGSHRIEARMRTVQGAAGPVSSVRIHVAGAPSGMHPAPRGDVRWAP